MVRRIWLTTLPILNYVNLEYNSRGHANLTAHKKPRIKQYMSKSIFPRLKYWILSRMVNLKRDILTLDCSAISSHWMIEKNSIGVSKGSTIIMTN